MFQSVELIYLNKLNRIADEFGESSLAKYNQLTMRKKQVKFMKSAIHGWGLFGTWFDLDTVEGWVYSGWFDTKVRVIGQTHGFST